MKPVLAIGFIFLLDSCSEPKAPPAAGPVGGTLKAPQMTQPVITSTTLATTTRTAVISPEGGNIRVRLFNPDTMAVLKSAAELRNFMNGHRDASKEGIACYENFTGVEKSRATEILQIMHAAGFTRITSLPKHK
jgi:hypothetical protein